MFHTVLSAQAPSVRSSWSAGVDHSTPRLLASSPRAKGWTHRRAQDGKNPNSLLSQLDKALANGEKIFNMSGGQQVRDYLPIEKAAEYIVKIALQQKIQGAINCCSCEPVTIEEFVKNYLKKENKKISLNLGYYPYPDYEPMAFWGDNNKLKRIINNE